MSNSKSNFNLTPADQPDSGEAAPSSLAPTPSTPKSTIAHHRRRGLIRHRSKWNHPMHSNQPSVVGSNSANHFNSALHRHRLQQQQQQQQHIQQMQFAAFNQQFGQFHPPQPSQGQNLAAFAFHGQHGPAHRSNMAHLGPPSMMAPTSMPMHQMQPRSSMLGPQLLPHISMAAHALHHAHSTHRKEVHHYRQSNNRRREQVSRSNTKSSRQGDSRDQQSQQQRPSNNLRPVAGSTLGKRLVPAPYNTTQFLMDDHKCREPELDSFSDLICKPGGGRDTDTEGALDADIEDGPESASANRRLHDRHLHTVNDESSSEEFYSSPDDEQDFMEKQFTEAYDNIHAERLDLMSKTELMQEVLLLEDRVKSLESQLKHHSDHSNGDSKDGPDDDLHVQPCADLDDESQASHLRSRLQLVTVDSSQSGPICDQSENSRLRSSSCSSSSSSSLSDSDCSSCVSDDPMVDVSGNENHVIVPADSDSDMQQLVEYLKHGINGVRPQVQEQLKRLLDENSQLKAENERLKAMLSQKQSNNSIQDRSEIEFVTKQNV